MRTLRLITTIVSAMALFGCSRAPVGPQFTKSDVEAITGRIGEFKTALNAADPDKVAALFAANAVVMPPNQSTARARDAVKEYYVGRFSEGAKDLELDPKDISGVGTLAYASGDFRLNLAAHADGEPQRDRGKFIWIFRKLKDQWLIEYVIFSSDFPPRGPVSEHS
jgi:ketosteroid isomerase-like protein